MARRINRQAMGNLETGIYEKILSRSSSTFCSLNKNKQECIICKKNAHLISSILIKRYSKFELEQAILETSHTTIEELLKEVISEKNIDYNDKVLFCAQREVTNQLMNKDLS